MNSNYFVAGQIVEKFSGKSYRDYIVEDVLAPIGVSTTDVARSEKAQVFPNEVTYYGQGGVAGFEYGFNLKRRAPGGGLLSTAPDVLRFVNAIDGAATRPDILNSESLNVLTTPSSVNDSYACGIGTWGNIWFNYGSLPGTRTGFMRHKNGMSVVLLLNSTKDYFNSEEFDPFVFAMQDILLGVVNKPNRAYKNIDQFE